jgi:hypothetical protein
MEGVYQTSFPQTSLLAGRLFLRRGEDNICECALERYIDRTQYGWRSCSAQIIRGHTAFFPPFSTHLENNSQNIPQTEKYYKQEFTEKRITFHGHFGLAVSAVITQNAMKTLSAEFQSYSNIYFKKCHFPSLCNIAY